MTQDSQGQLRTSQEKIKFQFLKRKSHGTTHKASPANIRLGWTDSDKHSSLLQYSINYSCKKVS